MVVASLDGTNGARADEFLGVLLGVLGLGGSLHGVDRLGLLTRSLQRLQRLFLWGNGGVLASSRRLGER